MQRGHESKGDTYTQKRIWKRKEKVVLLLSEPPSLLLTIIWGTGCLTHRHKRQHRAELVERKVSKLILEAFRLCKLDPSLSRRWMAYNNATVASLKNKLFGVTCCFIKQSPHSHLWAQLTHRLWKPQDKKGEVSSITAGPFTHSRLCISVLPPWTFGFHLWFSNLHPGSPKESKMCLSYITDAPTLRPWDSRVVLACFFGSPSYCNLRLTLYFILFVQSFTKLKKRNPWLLVFFSFLKTERSPSLRSPTIWVGP